MNELAKQEGQVVNMPAREVTPVGMITTAIEKGIETEQLRELMALEREWREDKARSAYAAAMAKFNGLKKVIPHNKKGKTAGNAPFSYSDFGALVNAVTPWLAECGLSFSHQKDKPVIGDNNQIAYQMVYCRLLHEDGHSEQTEFMAIPDLRLNGKVSPSQLLQLAVTYAKRQTLSEALGLATSEDAKDDDSAGAMTCKPGEQPLTNEQLKRLRDAMKVAGVDDAAMCKRASVEKIEDIVQGRMGGAMKWVQQQAQGAQQ